LQSIGPKNSLFPQKLHKTSEILIYQFSSSTFEWTGSFGNGMLRVCHFAVW